MAGYGDIENPVLESNAFYCRSLFAELHLDATKYANKLRRNAHKLEALQVYFEGRPLSAVQKRYLGMDSLLVENQISED